MAGEPNLYELLQVDRRASQEVIEAAYLRLALKYHPDVNTSRDAVLMMQKLNNAYQVLSNPVSRADYDRRIFGAEEQPKSEERRSDLHTTATPQSIVPTKKKTRWNRSALVSISVLALLTLLLLIPNLSSQLPGNPSDESSADPSRFGTPIFNPTMSVDDIRTTMAGINRYGASTFIPPTPTPLPSRLWVCVDIAYGHRDPYEGSPILFQMSRRDGWYIDLLANPHATSDNWIATNWTASSTGLAWMKLSDLCGSKPPSLAAVTPTWDFEKALNDFFGTRTSSLPPVPPMATRPPLACGDLPPGMAGLLFINHFPGEATVTIVDHEYHVPGNSQLLIPIPAGKRFTVDVFIPGVGRYRPALGPFTWDAGECQTLEPHN